MGRGAVAPRPSGFALVAAVLAVLTGAGAWAQTPPGTTVSNQALVSFAGTGGRSEVAYSNRVDVVTTVARTAAEILFTRTTTAAGTFFEPVGPAACIVGGTPTPLADPAPVGLAVIDPATPWPLIGTTVFHAGEAVFVRLDDFDQNLDAAIRERVRVEIESLATGDVETIELTETAADSGVFAGYAPSGIGQPSPADCIVQGARDSSIEVRYVDPADASDTAVAMAELDPTSRVFDALTGQPVDGADVTLIDTTTGLPASPVGDDGASAFPSTVTAGGTIADAGGAAYDFGPGEFRFPIVPPGRYRLAIAPPAGYLAPSTRSEAELQVLAGAPFTLGAGSFGNEFDVGPSPFISLDVPIDPAAGTLFLDKRGSADVAGPGDFVEYRLTLSHAGGLVPAGDAVVDDFMPPGLRYVTGSARRLEPPGPIEPRVAPDGRQLSFDVGSLDPDAEVALSYVAAVVPGARGDEIVNRAQATATTGVSNEATATLRLLDDLFSSESFIVGRVGLGVCARPGSFEDDGVAGVRVYLEDGRFAVSDEGGRFHFEGVPAGTHVVQLDLESLPSNFELADCTGLVPHAGTSQSRFVDLEPGALGRADFALVRRPPPSGRVRLELEQSATSGPQGDVFEYLVALGTDETIVTENVQLMLMLPPGFAAARGGPVSGSGAPLALRADGDVVTIDLGSRQGPWHEQVAFTAVSNDDPEGELITRALVRFTFDGAGRTTPLAETRAEATPGVTLAREYVLDLNFETLSANLGAGDRAELDALLPDWRGIRDIRLEAVGHSDSVPISPASQTLFPDNYALSEARARAVVDYLGTALVLTPDQYGYRGLGPDRPVADNGTAAGRRANRRVELKVSGVARARARTVTVSRPVSGPQAILVEAAESPLPPLSHPAPNLDAGPRELSRESEISIERLEPGVGFVWPEPGYSPAVPTTKVVIRHRPGTTVALSLNGAEVSALNFEGVEIAADRGVALSRWRGLDLADGPNLLEARVHDADGERLLERDVHFAGPPVRGDLLEPQSTLIADGKTRPLVAIRFVDRWDEPAREGSVAQFAVEPPHRSWWEVERLRENPLVLSGDRTPLVTIGPGGLAAIELEPTTRTGGVGLTVRYGNAPEQEFRTALAPAERDWILVGLAEGTVGYRKVSGAVADAAAAGLDDDYYEDGRLAFYAKGQVKGSLLTFAFDSEGENDDREAFGGTIDPDRYYTVYGDNSEQRFDAASRERLYVKIERGAFFAMVGDFETGLTVTELSRYSRSLTGFHSESYGDRVRYSAFAAPAEQAFIKDEIRGNGTSGPYRLTRSDLLPGSDKLTLESRDRFRPESITSTRTLRRHFDYDIDYATGVVFFREPIPSRDFDFNPVYIVADYELDGPSAGGLLAGGRVGVGYGSNDSEVGVTVIDDGSRGAAGRLLGADMTHRFSPKLELRAELAATEREDTTTGSEVADSAYLVEFLHRAGNRQIEAYWRETGADFGLGQQRASESGTRRGGVTMRNELSDTWLVETEMFRQQNLLDGATRSVVEGESRYQDSRRTASMGLRHVDEAIGVDRRAVSQAFAGGSWRFFEDLLTTRISLESALSGENESIDYPTRTLIGADVSVASRVRIFGEHEIAQGATGDVRMTRLGVKANPAERSQIDTAVERQMTEYGPRSFATLGLRQGFAIGDHWTLDLGAERADALDAPDDAVVDPRVPPASGSKTGDFAAGFFGVAYRAANWSFTSRLEQREAENERQQSLLAGFYRERTAGRGFSAELRLLDRAAADTRRFGGNLRLGWAYRPADSRWTLLERADWIAERRSGDVRINRNVRLVNNFNAHVALDERQSLGVRFGLKSVQATFDALAVDGLVGLAGVEWRRGLSEKLDFGLHASLYRAAELDVAERGWGMDVGVNLAHNLNLTVGYNFEGFDDDDFSRAGYTSRGPFVQFRLKIDQASLAELLRR